MYVWQSNPPLFICTGANLLELYNAGKDGGFLHECFTRGKKIDKGEIIRTSKQAKGVQFFIYFSFHRNDNKTNVSGDNIIDEEIALECAIIYL